VLLWCFSKDRGAGIEETPNSDGNDVSDHNDRTMRNDMDDLEEAIPKMIALEFRVDTDIDLKPMGTQEAYQEANPPANLKLLKNY